MCVAPLPANEPQDELANHTAPANARSMFRYQFTGVIIAGLFAAVMRAVYPGAHSSGSRRCAARWPHRKPPAETPRRRHRDRKAMLANPDISGTQITQRLGVSPATTLSLHRRRANREYFGRLTRATLLQRPDAPRGFSAGGARRLSAESSRSLDHGPSPGLSRCQGLG